MCALSPFPSLLNAHSPVQPHKLLARPTRCFIVVSRALPSEMNVRNFS